MARGTTVSYTSKLVVEECFACGMDFAMPQDWQERRIKKQDTFYCPAGHAQNYIGKTEEQRLREQLARAEQEAQEAEAMQREEQRLRREAERKAKKLENVLLDQVKIRVSMEEKIHAGVCPHCNRSFTNVRRHMRSKHLTEQDRMDEIASSKAS